MKDETAEVAKKTEQNDAKTATDDDRAYRCYGQIGISAGRGRRALSGQRQESGLCAAPTNWDERTPSDGRLTRRAHDFRPCGEKGDAKSPFSFLIAVMPVAGFDAIWPRSRGWLVAREPNLERRQRRDIPPIATSMVMASLSWKPSSQGDTISVRPAIRLSHSSQTAKAASAAIDSTAMIIPKMEAVCHCAPVDRPNSQGEKNRTTPRMQVHHVAEPYARPVVHEVLPATRALVRRTALADLPHAQTASGAMVPPRLSFRLARSQCGMT